MTVTVVDAKPFADAISSAMTAQSVTYAEGRKPTGVTNQPYIVGWLDDGAIGDSSLRGRDGFTLTVVLQCYGLSPDAVRVALRKGRAAMFSLARSTVGGRLLGLPTHETPPPTSRDDKVDPPLFWLTDVWRIPTSPA